MANLVATYGGVEFKNPIVAAAAREMVRRGRISLRPVVGRLWCGDDQNALRSRERR